MPQLEKGKMRAPDYMRSISHLYRTLSSSASTLQRTKQRQREDVLLCAVALNITEINMEIRKVVQQYTYLYETYHVAFVSIIGREIIISDLFARTTKHVDWCLPLN